MSLSNLKTLNKLRIRQLADGWADCEKILSSRSKSPELPLSTLPELNKKIWGLRKSALTLIGARTSHGKSALACQIAFDISAQGKSVMFLSLEMAESEIQERIFCNRQRIDNYHLLTGHFDTYKDRAIKHKEELIGKSLAFSDCIGFTWKEIDDFLTGMTQRPDVIILDYIQAIKNVGKNTKEDIDEYVRHFREMAKRYNFAGVLVSQVNRASQDGSDKEPHLHQLKGSGVLEEHSDIILLCYWADSDKTTYQIEVAKNRNGRTGYINLKYIPEHYLFEDMPRESIVIQQKEFQIKTEWEE